MTFFHFMHEIALKRESYIVWDLRKFSKGDIWHVKVDIYSNL